ncbi:LLM class flavin-dependent oxidoreductase [Sinorhizobium meliloti]|uniref:LLM class flavin-dependent oxidoreductase n=1 Tax=Rhizobium meliloti TaxID=382 RepID=UPI001F21305D|nr:LLM class flavin-dependent oxidoreductase [Sinorhizobium meliloti]
MNIVPSSTHPAAATSGASYEAFANHPGYRRMFAPDRLTIGIFLPLRFFQGDMTVLQGQSELVAEIDMESRGERFAEAVSYFRHLTAPGRPQISSRLGALNGADFLPKPAAGRIPLIVTGSSRQDRTWLAENADGWLTYPQATHTAEGPQRLANIIQDWRTKIPDGGFRPHMTNDWLDLVDDPDFPRTPLRGGFVLKTGRKGLIDLLSEWKKAGVNHAALGIQFSERPAKEIIQELAEEILPLFPSLEGPEPLSAKW